MNTVGLVATYKGAELTNGAYLKLAVEAVEKRIGMGLARNTGHYADITLDAVVNLLPDKAELERRGKPAERRAVEPVQEYDFYGNPKRARV